MIWIAKEVLTSSRLGPTLPNDELLLLLFIILILGDNNLLAFGPPLNPHPNFIISKYEAKGQVSQKTARRVRTRITPNI